MNEAAFIKKVNRALSSAIYKWKINDPYHGGVPDAYYSGPGDFCFVEYKYNPKLPVRGTSKINFMLSAQQELWLHKQQSFGIPVFVIAGCEDKVVHLRTDFSKVNHYVKNTFLEEASTFKELVELLNEHCLGETNG